MTNDLNQFAISQALGSKMRPVKSANFGIFTLLETTAEALQANVAHDDTEGMTDGDTDTEAHRGRPSN